MIRLEREREAVPTAFKGDKRVKRALELVETWVAGEKLAPNSAYWKVAKSQINRESAGKCAYCEGKVDTVAHGDVEHFRPKKTYWWLAYCYDNYLYACQVCNEVYKRDNFPVSSFPMRAPAKPRRRNATTLRRVAVEMAPDPIDAVAVAAFQVLARNEQAQLVDPYSEDPEPLFGWEPDPVLKEVRLVPRDGTKRAREAVAAAEQHLGLNREELRRMRWSVYEELRTFLDILREPLAQAMKDRVAAQIAAMTGPAAQFAGMARFFAP